LAWWFTGELWSFRWRPVFPVLRGSLLLSVLLLSALLLSALLLLSAGCCGSGLLSCVRRTGRRASSAGTASGKLVVLLRGREELLPLCQGMPGGLGSSFAATAVRLAAVAPACWRAASPLNEEAVDRSARVARLHDSAIFRVDRRRDEACALRVRFKTRIDQTLISR
jgi:hypothetical protein